MTQALEGKPSKETISREPLNTSEINFLTQMVYILNKHASEKVCRHNVKMIAEEVRILEEGKL